MRAFSPIVFVLAGVASAAPPAYVVSDLGTLSGANEVFEPGTVGLALSSSTEVGYSVTMLEHRNFHAFRVIDGTMQDLGVLRGDEHSVAFGTCGIGDTVGVSYALGDLVYHGVRWNADGSVVQLGNVEPRDIRNNGSIAGSAQVLSAPGTTHAALIVGNVTTDLGTLGGPSSMGMALNSSNWVVGQSMRADGVTWRGFVYRNGAMIDLGTLGGPTSSALDIAGLQVVGVADTAAGVPHAVLWTLTAAGNVATVTDLGLLPETPNSAAYSVNGSGAVVGICGDSAFVWTGGAMVDLNTQVVPNSGWRLMRATAIDADGRIIGTGKHLGLQRAFVLTPRVPSDLNADGIVNAADLALLLGGWGGSEFDLDGNGTVNAADLAILLGAWNA